MNTGRKREKILVVDDSDMNQAIVKDYLETNGYFVEQAQNGKKALEILKEEEFDLVLLDIMMPELNGFEVCEQLKNDAHYGLNKATPVIFVTAEKDNKSIVKGFDLGAVDYIVTPFESTELIARIKTHLDLEHSRDRLLNELAHRKRMEEILRKRERYLDTLVTVQWYLMIFDEDENYRQRVLKMLCEVTKADRAYIYENSIEKSGKVLMNHKIEWALEEKKTITNLESFQDISYEEEYSGWFADLSKEMLISTTRSQTQGQEIQYFDKRGAQAVLLLPLTVNNRFYGFLGFDNCKSEKLWNSWEINALRSAAATLSVYEEKRMAVNALKESEQDLREANITKDKVFSIIAHDLRGPMGAIKQVLELIVDSPDYLSQEVAADLLAQTKQSSESTFALLEDLLYWSRNQQNKLKFQPENIALAPKVQEVYELLGNNAKMKGIFLENKIPAKATAIADNEMFNIIVRNLVSNAIKFTPEGGTIWVKSEEKEKMIQVSVVDNGIGITEEDMQKVFKSDEYITTYGTNAEKGSGLGLNLCKEFVEKHGGQIWVESEVGKGTTFAFTLIKGSKGQNGKIDINDPINELIKYLKLKHELPKEFLMKLNNDLIPQYLNICKISASNEIVKFANDLIAVGEKYDIRPMLQYANELLRFSSTIEVEKMNNSLNKFQRFVNLVRERHL